MTLWINPVFVDARELRVRTLRLSDKHPLATAASDVSPSNVPYYLSTISGFVSSDIFSPIVSSVLPRTEDPSHSRTHVWGISLQRTLNATIVPACDDFFAVCRRLVWSGLRQMALDAVCIVVAALIGIDNQLDKALLSTTVVCFLVGLLCLGKSATTNIIRWRKISTPLFETKRSACMRRGGGARRVCTPGIDTTTVAW